MQWQLNTLSNTGLLSRFIGMLTDSRSFMSLTRHEYFRRILCDMLGSDIENGELPFATRMPKTIWGWWFHSAQDNLVLECTA